jgi:hypothetical protein
LLLIIASFPQALSLKPPQNIIRHLMASRREKNCAGRTAQAADRATRAVLPALCDKSIDACNRMCNTLTLANIFIDGINASTACPLKNDRVKLNGTKGQGRASKKTLVG